MASSSAPVSVFDEHRFRKEFNQQLFESHARRRKVIPKVGFNLDEDEYPQIMEQILLRGWRTLAAPMTSVSKLLVQEFDANVAISEEEAAEQEELPYKNFVRVVKVDFSPTNIRRVMRFKRETAGAEMDHKTHQAMDQRLDEDLADLREEVRAEEIIADNMVVIAQGLQNKGNLAFPSTIYKLCKDVGVPLREFRRTSRIPEESYITAKRMESTRIPRNLPQQQEDDDEDEPMPQAG
ncbi:hypothetical protein PIB30_090261 [Stylosanthes scabra]|uniref:Uncharacterized protein n=1 Tax=Stylosanthes scabra TaxID=79078 RepID=A0ABU6XUH0_9FABA|nr:hypothetical protein [Stylosanthes scabra]